MNFFDNKKYGEELYTSIIIPLCERHNITHMEYTILMFLNYYPEYNTASKIIKEHFLTKSHVSITLKSLMDKQLIVGEHKGNNLRTIYLKLCDSAKPIIDDAIKTCDVFTSILLKGFTQDEISQLSKLLNNINNNVIEYLNKKKGEV